MGAWIKHFIRPNDQRNNNQKRISSSTYYIHTSKPGKRKVIPISSVLITTQRIAVILHILHAPNLHLFLSNGLLQAARNVLLALSLGPPSFTFLPGTQISSSLDAAKPTSSG